MSLWMGEAKVHELYTAACGLYVCWLLLRIGTVLYNWIPQGTAAILNKLKEWLILVSCLVVLFCGFTIDFEIYIRQLMSCSMFLWFNVWEQFPTACGLYVLFPQLKTGTVVVTARHVTVFSSSCACSMWFLITHMNCFIQVYKWVPTIETSQCAMTANCSDNCGLMPKV